MQLPAPRAGHPTPLALALVLACSGAGAETSPYYVGGAIGLTHETNVFRAPSGQPEVNDDVVTGTLLAGIDQPFGRQRAHGTLTLRDNRYRDQTALNNVSYGASLGLDWATAERFSGTIALNSNQSLARFSPGDAPTLTKKNVERSQGVSATARVGVVTRLTAELTLSHSDLSYTASEFDYREYRQDTGSVGLQYRFSSALYGAISLKHTDGRFPRFRESAPGVFTPDVFKRDDLQLSGTWLPSGASTISARLSGSRSNHSVAQNQSFDTVTGSASWNWRPGGKFQMSTTLTRDSGLESTEFSIFNGFVTGRTDNSRLTTWLRWSGAYELTGKISVSATVSHSERSLSDTLANSLGVNNNVTGSDHTDSVALGLRWVPQRSTQVGCDLSQDRRGTSGTLSQPYTTSSAGCYVQFVLQ